MVRSCSLSILKITTDWSWRGKGAMNQGLAPARVPPPGRILMRELEARGWTQKDLAEIMGASGSNH